MKNSEFAATGFVAFVICFAVVLGVVLSNRPSPRDANADKSNQQQPAPYTHQPQLGTESAPLVIAVVDSPTAKVGSTQTKYWADNKPSEWWMIWVAIFAAVVAGIQARFFWTQLKLMKDALNEAAKNAQGAVDAAIAARESIVLAKNNAKIQLRAYVSLRPSEKKRDQPDPNIFYLTLVNSGPTPAKDLSGSVFWRYFVGAKVGWPRNMPFDKPTIAGSVVTGAPQIPIEYELHLGKLADGTPYSELLVKARRGEVTLYVLGKVTYRDVFNDPQHTEFCFVYASDGPEGWIVYHDHNEST